MVHPGCLTPTTQLSRSVLSPSNKAEEFLVYFTSLSSDTVKSHPLLLPARTSVFVFFWVLHILQTSMWRWEFIPAMPVCIFSSLRNKSSGQALHSQALNLSFSERTSLTGSLNFSAFSLLNLRIPFPAFPGVYLFLS